MKNYQHILVPLDLQHDSEKVLEAGMDSCARHGARLTVLHVVEYAPVDPGGDILLPAPVDITEQLATRARAQLGDLCRNCGAGDATQRVVIGSIKGEILRAAESDAIDLIVIGNHERHGLAILLNHTEDTLLHEAPCDILAIRLKR
jgi:universal stress protein A